MTELWQLQRAFAPVHHLRLLGEASGLTRPRILENNTPSFNCQNQKAILLKKYHGLSVTAWPF